MSTLFTAAGIEKGATRPLADRLRPEALEEVVGQDHLVGPEGPLGRMMAAGNLSSLVFWGPPGTGKTTIARIVARESGYVFVQLSAIFSGVAELRKIFDEARRRRDEGAGTLLFVDEIHRFNRSQQDSFLPVVEDGTILLVGATTENPSFELNAALLSRMQVLVLKRLDDAALEELLVRAEAYEGRALPLTAEARTALKVIADGDGRYLLNCAEALFGLEVGEPIGPAGLGDVLQRRAPVYDKAEDSHYNLMSALHKSLRGSDADASLYWLARMLTAGEDPLYIARRLVRFANEDIGLADPEAVHQALAAKQVYDFLGSPEGEIGLVQAVIYLATAPKSNALYLAEKGAKRAARETGSLMPPMHILNAPTSMMKEMGYGADYDYDHDADNAFSGQDYFPDDMKRGSYYRPRDRGFEREVKKRLDYWAKLRLNRRDGGSDESG